MSRSALPRPCRRPSPRNAAGSLKLSPARARTCVRHGGHRSGFGAFDDRVGWSNAPSSQLGGRSREMDAVRRWTRRGRPTLCASCCLMGRRLVCVVLCEQARGDIPGRKHTTERVECVCRFWGRLLRRVVDRGRTACNSCRSILHNLENVILPLRNARVYWQWYLRL